MATLASYFIYLFYFIFWTLPFLIILLLYILVTTMKFNYYWRPTTWSS